MEQGAQFYVCGTEIQQRNRFSTRSFLSIPPLALVRMPARRIGEGSRRPRQERQTRVEVIRS